MDRQNSKYPDVAKIWLRRQSGALHVCQTQYIANCRHLDLRHAYHIYTFKNDQPGDFCRNIHRSRPRHNGLCHRDIGMVRMVERYALYAIWWFVNSLWQVADTQWWIAFRELVQLQNGQISSIALVPEFSWLLVLSSGILLAFNLKRMMPTSDPSTWISMGRAQGQLLNQPGHSAAWIYTGKTKGRTLSELSIVCVVLGRTDCWGMESNICRL